MDSIILGVCAVKAKIYRKGKVDRAQQDQTSIALPCNIVHLAIFVGKGEI